MPGAPLPASERGRACAWLRRRAWWLAPVFVALCLMLPKCWQGGWAVDMGRYAGVGYQSWTRIFDGDLTAFYALTEATHPPPRGEPALPYYNKPPLPLLIHGLALHAFGRNLWATRLPAIIAMAASVGLLAWTARALAGRRFGLLAGLVAATTVALVRHAAQISLDVWQLLFLALCVALTAHAVALLPLDGRRAHRWVVLAGAVIGLALLCKPLVGLMIVPLLAAWLAWIGCARLIAPLALGTLAGLALPATWYALAYVHWGPVFFTEHFGRQIVERARGEMNNMNDGAESPLYYLHKLAHDFWPWAVTTALGFWLLARARLTGGVRRAALLALCVGVGWLVLCSLFADKRTRYLLPSVWVWPLASAAWITVCTWPWATLARGHFVRWALPVACVAAAVVSVLPISVHPSPSPQWQRIIDVIERGRLAPVYGAGLAMQDRCRYMLTTGAWPYPLSGDSGTRIATPPPGAFVLYDTRSWRPGPGEPIIVTGGRYVLTLVAGAWYGARVSREPDRDSTD